MTRTWIRTDVVHVTGDHEVHHARLKSVEADIEAVGGRVTQLSHAVSRDADYEAPLYSTVLVWEVEVTR